MRTTVSLDDDLLRDAKARANAQGLTLSDLVAESLRERLARAPATPATRYAPVIFSGQGLQAGVDLNDNAGVRDLMDRA